MPRLPLPPNHRPAWRLRRAVIEVVAAIALVSGIIQVEQRLFPALLSEPDWLAMVLYAGGILLPLTRLGRTAFLEVRCAWDRIRWYPAAHRQATELMEQVDAMRSTAEAQRAVIADQTEQLIRAAEFADRTIWAVTYLPRAMIVETAYEDGRLILVAESALELRVTPGDTFVVVGQEPLAVLGEFRFIRQTERGYYLQATAIRDNLWWASVRQDGRAGTLASRGLVAIQVPALRLDLE